MTGSALKIFFHMRNPNHLRNEKIVLTRTIEIPNEVMIARHNGYHITEVKCELI